MIVVHPDMVKDKELFDKDIADAAINNWKSLDKVVATKSKSICKKHNQKKNKIARRSRKANLKNN